MTKTLNTDVTILGGGLAGLTLARQLQREHPELDVVVLEKKATPFPRAIHKVGESTVEIGAHYLQQVVGLHDHLSDAHLRKYGLRLFFGEASDDLAHADELGTTRELAIPTWQVDRGVLETELVDNARQAGHRVIDRCKLTGLNLDRARKTVNFENADGTHELKSRWLIDAAGRTSVIKPRLGLAQPSSHRGDAVWFRVDKRIDIDDWSNCDAWRNRCGENMRWLSTNHLMGPGYWVWLIPLACGATSIGIVTDPEIHPVSEMRSWPLALQWLAQHQPRLYDCVHDVEPMDYRLLRNYPHECSEVMSAERWALTGESGVFLDPFYSPGTDFIGINNTFLSDLIGRDVAGEDIGERTAQYQRLFFSFYESSLLLYRDLYPGFGDAALMNLKTVWDYAYYWGILAPIFFSRSMVDSDQISKNLVNLAKTQRLHQNIQARFQARASQAQRQRPRGVFIDQSAIPCLARYNSGLKQLMPDSDISQTIQQNTADLHEVARVLTDILENGPAGPSSNVEADLLGDFRQRLAG